MSRKTKQYERLEALEAHFRTELTQELKDAAANSHSQLFLSTRHNPWPEITPWTNKATDKLLDMAAEILDLRGKLNETVKSTLASRFVEYCEEFNNPGNPQRLGVQRHAQRLLQEIETGKLTEWKRRAQWRVV